MSKKSPSQFKILNDTHDLMTLMTHLHRMSAVQPMLSRIGYAHAISSGASLRGAVFVFFNYLYTSMETTFLSTEAWQKRLYLRAPGRGDTGTVPYSFLFLAAKLHRLL